MKTKKSQLFSILSLVLAISLAPILACACMDPVQMDHACCPESSDPSGETQQAESNQACCELDKATPQNIQISVITEATTLLPLGLVPNFISNISIVSEKSSFLIACGGEGDPSPPQVYLKNQSLLL